MGKNRQTHTYICGIPYRISDFFPLRTPNLLPAAEAAQVNDVTQKWVAITSITIKARYISMIKNYQTGTGAIRSRWETHKENTCQSATKFGKKRDFCKKELIKSSTEMHQIFISVVSKIYV